MSRNEGEVREIPFRRNDMKDQPTTTGRSLDHADAPGKADSECAQETETPKGNVTINIDDAQLNHTDENKI
jgi:hypothetical protein